MKRLRLGTSNWFVPLGIVLAGLLALSVPALAQGEGVLEGPVCCDLAGASDGDSVCTVETVDACLAASGAPILSEMCCTLDEIVALDCTPGGTCRTGQEGECGAGRYECRDGGLACVPVEEGCETVPVDEPATPAVTPAP